MLEKVSHSFFPDVIFDKNVQNNADGAQHNGVKEKCVNLMFQTSEAGVIGECPILIPIDLFLSISTGWFLRSTTSFCSLRWVAKA